MTPDSERRGGGRRRAGLVLALVALVPVVLFSMYMTLVLHWSYSDGERAGYLQKFSRKGWVCKTYEGELAMTTMPGVAPTIWSFSVREESVAKEVRDAIGKRVVLHYTEHRGVPTRCFGETNYFVDAVRVEE